MTANLPELLSRLATKTNLLTERFSLVKQQRDEARKRCDELQTETDALKSRLQQAETEIEYLRISHRIAPTEADSKVTMDMLASMIKKIDKCIAKLRND